MVKSDLGGPPGGDRPVRRRTPLTILYYTESGKDNDRTGLVTNRKKQLLLCRKPKHLDAYGLWLDLGPKRKADYTIPNRGYAADHGLEMTRHQ